MSKHYKQKFNQFWCNDPELAIWIEKPTEEGQTAYCKYCRVHLTGSKSLMIRHGHSPKHKRRVEVGKQFEIIAANGKKSGKKKSSLVPRKQVTTIETVRQAEMRLCAYVAENNLPIHLMNTLPGLLKALDPESPVLQHITCSHTKTAYLMKNALATNTLNTLANKLRNNFFSFIVEDIQKFLVVIVRYYDEDLKDVEDSFFNIIDIENSFNCIELFEEILNFLNSINVPASNLLALSHYKSSTTEGPSQRVQELSQYAYIPGDVDHNILGCVTEACKELPTPVEDLCNDIVKFIEKKKSKGSASLILDSKFRAAIKSSPTNQVSLCTVVDVIAENWDDLVSQFNMSATHDREKKAETILQSLRNPIFKAYFTFLHLFLLNVKQITQESENKTQSLAVLLMGIADELKRVLRYYMQSEYVDETPISSLKPGDNRYFLRLDQVYFAIDLTALKQDIDPLFYGEISDFQMRCLNFYVVFCEQLLKKIDFTDPILQNLIMLSPQRCKSDFFPSIIPLAKYFPNLGDENMYELLDREWRLVKASSTLSSELELIAFWNKVFDQKYELAKAKPKHPELTKFVKAMLCLPHTSGNVERIFEKVNAHNLKNKIKQKRETPMINSLLLTKEMLKRTSAKDFVISDELMSLAKVANNRKHT